MRWRKRARAGATAAAGAGLLAAQLGTAASPAAADENYNPTTWNGFKIYLSPARHSDAGGRGECAGQNENDMALRNARLATFGGGSLDLESRGYKVQIGTGTVASAIANSNAWGANGHVVVHSNAQGGGCDAVTDPARNGTVGIYRSGSSGGQGLADRFVTNVGQVTPGTNDYKCFNPGHPCTTIDLAELRDTAAVAAYIEVEFHTWKSGTNFLTDDGWQFRFGIAVDQHYGYP